MRLKIIGAIARILGAKFAGKTTQKQEANKMPVVVLIPLIEQALRLINNLIESEPIELRQAKSIIIFKAASPLFMWMIPKEMRKDIDVLIDAIGTSPTLPPVPEVPNETETQ